MKLENLESRKKEKDDINNVSNNFGDYYFTRNRLRFFAKYIDENKLEEYENDILENTFGQLYGSLRKGRLDVFILKIIMNN